MNRKKVVFLDYERAKKFANEHDGTIEIKFWNCGQKDYIVTYWG